MQATMMHATRQLNKSQFYNYLHARSDGRLRREAMELKRSIRAPEGLPGYDAREYMPKIIDFWNSQQSRHVFAGFVFNSSGHYKPMLKCGPKEYDTPIVLYHDKDHFDGVRSVRGLFGRPYCLACEKPYDNAKRHSMHCKARCQNCSRMGPDYPCPKFIGYYKNCHGCTKTFRNNECYREHLANGFCKDSKCCQKCGEIWRVSLNCRNGRKGHVCGEKHCKTCNDYHNPERGCYIRAINPQDYKPARFVAFDLETTQNKVLDGTGTKREHEPNFVAAKVVCQECIRTGKWKQSLRWQPCQVCGPNRTVTFGHRPYSETPTDRHFVSREPLKKFVHWILYELPVKYKTYAFSHFGGKFDMVLCFKELFMEGLNPSMLRRGNKMYEMKVRKRKGQKANRDRGIPARLPNPDVIFRDSFNLMNMKLEALVSAFDLDVQDKGAFPHLYNIEANYGIRRQGLPPKEDYLYNGMMPAKKKAFDQWYEQHRHEEFYLDEALASYCCNDVDILMAALVAFREEFMEVSCRPENHLGEADRPSRKPHEGIDPLIECMTIASACMRHFKANHLLDNHLALVPERGYDWADSQSLAALKYFQYLSETTGKNIQHAHNGGEKRFGEYRVDGWIEEDRQVLEFNGCAWHGCPECWEDDEMTPTGLTAAKQRERDAERLAKIREIEPDINIKIIWSHEVDEQLKHDVEMQKKFDEYLDEGPINIRAGFMGGRTGPLKLYHEAQPGEEISYLDVTSLYPFINSIVRYMTDHPKVHIVNEDCDWQKPEDMPFPLAIYKVFVVPPRRIDVPVLPVKFERDNRLLFPLCMACARKFPNGAVDEEYSCPHNDRQRGWVSVCTSAELHEALAEGYQVKKLYRVLEYKLSDDSLFRPYMREFLAQKFHASGFDERIRGNPEEEEKFIEECMERFGIEIDRDKMKPNKGKRSLAKLALNNLWGRFSMRNLGLAQTLITDDPCVLGEYLDKKSIEVTAIDELTEQTIMITYTKNREWVEEHDCSNVVISMWTTSCARLLLLKLMQAVARSDGCRILYTDTDSIIFTHPEGKNPFEPGNFPESVKLPPVLTEGLPAGWRPQIGPHLGDLTDEYPQHEIVEFVSGGAKQYGLKLRRRGAPAGEFEYVLKIRGMTLNEDIIENQGLRYETFKASVLKYARTGIPPIISVLYPNFIRSSIRKGMVTSQPMNKIYKPYVGKGIIKPSTYEVLDFGYICPN